VDAEVKESGPNAFPPVFDEVADCSEKYAVKDVFQDRFTNPNP
jgi:hypothetical protein